MNKVKEKVTRERLKALRDGESITVVCSDGYDLDSQKNTAYNFQKMVSAKFSCSVMGNTLTVTRHDIA